MTRTSIDRFFLVTFPNDALSNVIPSGQSKRIGRRVPVADFPRQTAAALIPVPQWCKFCLQPQRKEWLSGEGVNTFARLLPGAHLVGRASFGWAVSRSSLTPTQTACARDVSVQINQLPVTPLHPMVAGIRRVL